MSLFPKIFIFDSFRFIQMIFYLFLCHVLFIPFINSSNTTVSKSDITNKTLYKSEPEPHKVNQTNETKVTLLSEGGSLLPGTSVLALPKDKLTSIDSELVKNKVKPVVARKGVVYIEDDNVKPQQNNVSTYNENPTVAPKILEKTGALRTNITVYTNKLNASKVNSSLLNKLSSGVKDMNKTEKHKKPLLISYDTLANMTVNSSPGTLVSDQIQSPNKDLKAYAKNANSHPGMIMPLVISILLVPMFAVLGYMALRRGQEAWKNRHYKRMDFLLDGMYND